MGIRTVPFIQFVPAEVGIVASGVTTNAGIWSADVNVGSYLTSKGIPFPNDAKGLLLAFTNSTTGQNWAGVRKKSATINHALQDQWGLSTAYVFIPYAEGELLQFYAENITTIKFYVVGIVDDSAVWFPATTAFPFILKESSGNWADRSVPSVPYGNTLILGWQSLTPAGRIRNNNETHEPDVFDNFTTYTLPSDNQIEIKSFIDVPYIGYFQSGVTQPSWRSVGFTPTKGAWTKAPVSYPGKSFIHISSDFAGGTNQLLFRPASGDGRAFNWGTIRNGKSQWVMLDSNGEFEYFASSGATISNIWVDSIINGYSEGVAAVTGPATVQVGAPFEITASTFGGAITAVEVTDSKGNFITITPGSTSLTIPLPISGSDYIQFGPITITLHSATKQASFNSTLVPNTGYAVAPMQAQFVGPGNISYGWPVPLTIGDQVLYPTAQSTIIYEDGRFSTNNTGEWTIFVIYADGFAESAKISAEETVTPPLGGRERFLASSNLTAHFLSTTYLY